MNAAVKAGKIAGFPDMKKQKNTDTQATGKNKEGYTIQFICLAYKKIAFYVVNGSSSSDENREKRGRMYDMFYKEFKNNL